MIKFLILHICAFASLFAVYEVKDFSYLLGRLEGLNEPLLKMHFTLYEGYVKNTNNLEHTLEQMASKGEDRTAAYGALIRRFGWEMDGMLLHELYFENLGGKEGLSPKTSLYRKITQDFGSYEAWKGNFVATGMIRGIGWVILYQDPKSGKLQNLWIDEHNINHIPGGKPLLVMDVWEHAYITDFGLNRGGYIEVFFKNIDWARVSKRFDQ
jgi:Fe-Mn family superoxide dismutase